MQKFQKTIVVAAIASEISHIFCCVLPTIFSALSLLTAFGLIGVIPMEITFLHDILHEWELPIIGVSALILALGWGLTVYSRRMDCHTNDACGHPPCKPKKSRSEKILLLATVLFLFNVTIYMVLHQGYKSFMPADGDHAAEQAETLHHH
jgi:hypothetical protein